MPRANSHRNRFPLHSHRSHHTLPNNPLPINITESAQADILFHHDSYPDWKARFPAVLQATQNTCLYRFDNETHNTSDSYSRRYRDVSKDTLLHLPLLISACTHLKNHTPLPSRRKTTTNHHNPRYRFRDT